MVDPKPVSEKTTPATISRDHSDSGAALAGDYSAQGKSQALETSLKAKRMTGVHEPAPDSSALRADIDGLRAIAVLPDRLHAFPTGSRRLVGVAFFSDSGS